eukprot:scaffold1955_cov39-Isochrysis_galbana.AAC.1
MGGGWSGVRWGIKGFGKGEGGWRGQIWKRLRGAARVEGEVVRGVRESEREREAQAGGGEACW